MRMVTLRPLSHFLRLRGRLNNPSEEAPCSDGDDDYVKVDLLISRVMLILTPLKMAHNDVFRSSHWPPTTPPAGQRTISAAQ